MLGPALRFATGRGAARAAAKGAQRKTLGDRIAGLSNLGFGIGQWSDLFARYYPSLTNTVRVKAQGSPTTPGNTVVQMCLAAGYGCVRTNKLCRIELSVQLNHTTNACELELKVINLAFMDAVETAMRQFETVKIGNITARGTANSVLDTASEVIPGVDLELRRRVEDLGKSFKELEFIKERRRREFEEQLKKQEAFERGLPPDPKPPGRGILAGVARAANRQRRLAPGVVRVGGPADAGQPPAVNTNLEAGDVDPAAGTLVKKTLQLYKAVSAGLGQDVIYRMGRHRIVGGPAPSVLAPTAAKVVGPLAGVARQLVRAQVAPFADMVGQTLLTRDAAPNPQPPAGGATVTGLNGLGTDLRTLVAQVLFDPGIRPPYPQTDAGPTPILSEERGV